MDSGEFGESDTAAGEGLPSIMLSEKSQLVSVKNEHCVHFI